MAKLPTQEWEIAWTALSNKIFQGLKAAPPETYEELFAVEAVLERMIEEAAIRLDLANKREWVGRNPNSITYMVRKVLGYWGP